MRRIEPQYRYRFTTDEIRSWYGSVEAAFDACDFNLAGQDAEDGSEIQGISFVLTGHVPAGAAILDKLPSPSPLAQIVRAYAAWYADDRSQALDILKEVPRGGRDGVLADQIKHIIGKDRIDVFCIAATPNYPMLGVDGRDRYHDPEYKLGQFYIKNVGTQLEQNAYDYSHNRSFAEFIEGLPESDRPELIISLVSQWLTPRDFGKVTIPKVLWHHDHDLFIHRFYDNYFAYDVNIACTSQEHFELSQVFGGFVATHHYSDVFGVPFSMPKDQTRDAEKDIDIVITGGGTLESFFRDKSSFAFMLSRLGDEISMTVVNGHLPRDEYVDLAGRAHSMPIPSRMCGNPSPRWRDPLMQGALLIYPEGTMYDKIAVGAFPHRNDDRFPDDFVRYLRARADGAPGYSPGEILADATEKFAFNATNRDNRMERFYRNAAFLCKFRDYKVRKRHSDDIEHRHRVVWQCPGLDFSVFGEANFIKKMGGLNELLTESGYGNDPNGLNNIAMNWFILGMMIGHLNGFRASDSVTKEVDGQKFSSTHLLTNFLHRAFDVLREGSEKYPDSALLLFNNIHWRFYMLNVIPHRHPDMVEKNREMVMRLESEIETYSQLFLESFPKMDFDPRNADVGVMSLHEYDPMFPYWDYGSLVVSYCAHKNGKCGGDSRTDIENIRNILLGSVHGILAELGFMKGDLESSVDRFRTAYRIYPDNPHVARRAFEVLVEYQEKQDHQSDELADEIIATFFSSGSLDPTCLLKNIDKVLPFLKHRGNDEEMRQLLKDWYYFISRIHNGALNRPLVEESAYYQTIHKYREFFPETFRNNLRALGRARGLRRKFLARDSNERHIIGWFEQKYLEAVRGV